jgi:hypothetical protein
MISVHDPGKEMLAEWLAVYGTTGVSTTVTVLLTQFNVVQLNCRKLLQAGHVTVEGHPIELPFQTASRAIVRWKHQSTLKPEGNTVTNRLRASPHAHSSSTAVSWLRTIYRNLFISSRKSSDAVIVSTLQTVPVAT